jgi:recombination protein RecA
MLDLAISNRPHGGIAVGKVTELNGLEGSGKSLIGAHILANTQKKGGIAIYIDTESAVSMDFLKVIGIDLNKLIYIQLEKLEDIYDTIEKIINKIRSSEKDKLVTILVDSLSSATTENEYKGDYQKEGWNTDKAIINSKAMRKVVNMIARKRIALVVTNQLRTKLGVMFGDKYCVDPFTTKIKIRYKKD